MKEATTPPSDPEVVAAAATTAWKEAEARKARKALLVPPEELFRTADYTGWDERGVPVCAIPD